MRWSPKLPWLSSVESVIFLTVFLTSVFFSEIAYQTSNYTARLFLTQAIVDHATFRLDSYSETVGVDAAYYDGHLYSNKPPGSSLMMLPQYVLVAKPFQALYQLADLDLTVSNQAYEIEDVVSGWLVQIFSLSLYSAIGFVYLYRILRLLGLKRRVAPLVLLSYFGTLMLPYSTIGTGEMFTVPPILLGTYYLLKSGENPAKSLGAAGGSIDLGSSQKWKPYFFSGLWFGMAFLTTNQAILFVLVAAAAIVWQERHGKPLLLFLTPVGIAGLLTLAYNWIAFGSPLSFPIQFWVQGTAEVILFEVPTLSKLTEMLFLPWKGLFFYSPFLILSLPGYLQLYRQVKRGADESGVQMPMVFFLIASFISYFLFLIINVGWFGGADFGFRYLIPALPFLCIGAAIWLSDRKLTAVEYALIGWSIFVCLVGTVTDPEVPTGIRNPLFSYNLPQITSTGTNNLPNLILEQLFGYEVWLVRIITSALFLILLGWIIWRERQLFGETAQ